MRISAGEAPSSSWGMIGGLFVFQCWREGLGVLAIKRRDCVDNLWFAGFDDGTRILRMSVLDSQAGCAMVSACQGDEARRHE